MTVKQVISPTWKLARHGKVSSPALGNSSTGIKNIKNNEYSFVLKAIKFGVIVLLLLTLSSN